MHPKNAFKYCPSCGSAGLSFHDNAGYLKCDKCGFQFFINEGGAVAAIIQDKEGNILFTKRANAPAQHKLDLPGGFVDIGETAEQALEREISEELNIHLFDYTYFMSQPNTYTYNRLTYFTLDLAFICKAASFKT
ncbi:MAG: NUDIX domain-containing protein [Bacteroidales bacterium]|nr:NUDIX domain-containing protein [Bacteroidales bacterium]